MALFDNNTVTLAGRKVLAHSLATGQPVEFIRMEIGNGYPPASPEGLEGLVNRIVVVPISHMRAHEGITTIRGAFKANDIVEEFYMREIGIIVKNAEGEETLFAYSNAGEKANYIPPGNGGSSLVEEVLIISIVTGDAKVLFQNLDPHSAATLEDVTEAIDSLNVDQIQSDIRTANDKLEEIKTEIEQSANGFVKKTGDVMTGPLESPLFKGKLEGSAIYWNGWAHFESIEAVNVATGSQLSGKNSTLVQIAAALPPHSRLIAHIAEPGNHMPGIGILEIQKLSAILAIASFSSVDGRHWKATVNNTSSTGWGECAAIPPGAVIAYCAKNPPLGYLFPQGQPVSRTKYAALFAVISTYFGGGDGINTFNLPDLRGYVIRSLDNGRGIDPGRILGSGQEDAIRDITGWFGPTDDQGPGASGAFYYHSGFSYDAQSFQHGNGSITGFAASRVVPTAHENRMKNFALNHLIKY